MINRSGVKRIVFVCWALLAAYPVMCQETVGKITCVCIDPGHGGKDPGAVGRKLKLYEKDIVLDISLRLGKLIQEQNPGVKVIYTRDKDVFIPLDQRGNIANKNKADLFISVHTNSNENRTAHGIETYVLGLGKSAENLAVAMKENAVIKYEEDYSLKYDGFDPTKPESYILFSLLQNLYLNNSLDFAGFVQHELVAEMKRSNRGVKQELYLVLKAVAMPSVLLEIGFISNEEEERYLNSKANRGKIAEAVARSFKQYKERVERNSRLLSADDTVSPENLQTPELPVAEKKPDSKLFFAVQVASASKRIEQTGTLCSVAPVQELNTGDRYRYYAGEYATFDEAKLKLDEIRKVNPGCFLIAVYEGDVIPMAEARKLEKELK
ncbi:MAG: N-acetylmuramoyl-L-alanine amidase [Culturomica sp.]|jgi:N-acetylmuramoyl-L-alanine amidase|nr:N-acetylmuramoyl-L-alanine amidase [Culturomica sp.]